MAISVGQEVKRVSGAVQLRAEELAKLEALVLQEVAQDLQPESWEGVSYSLITEALVELDLEGLEHGRDPIAEEAESNILRLGDYLSLCLTLAYYPSDGDKETNRHLRAERRSVKDRILADDLSPYAVGLAQSYHERYMMARVAAQRAKAEPNYAVEERVKVDVVAGENKSLAEKVTSELTEERTKKVLPPIRPTNCSDSIRKDLTEEAVEKIRKAAEATKPPPGGVFTVREGSGQTLSEFRAYFQTLSNQRAWGDVHAFFWLCKFVDTSLWMNISLAQGQKILCDPLCRSSYTDAVKVVWSALERLSGREKERESLLSEGQRLAQQPGEAVMAFLYRVNRYKQKCEFAGVTADTAHWLSLARVGMRDELSKKLSYLVNVGKPEVSSLCGGTPGGGQL
ncbi:hypothetical protein Pmar_PMAR011436 [Perkinsus marinus ATCC 50983]|uniref:Uncharacterized protein n=1 Tax=Perkinsus marinus (strain ATCC 50983 / TXsc) TaxID=423536 RepID=C5LGD4_PERM5|nr:hypothetical protein Pmar_PMAR011436 [Perkinsus marinus ATCC 50983]EER04210.1 hypothetical protein Pmar_PMAR011436 [Perkinsus marinus ATCC 50983]|eukprot:XP_002772394.1 hypothetical protein Pmar_PMAR011436 [Perkinsus marinus ATCC 50983]